MYILYALSSSSYPKEMKYVGVTGLSASRRLTDLINNAKYRERHGLQRSRLVRWVLEELNADRRPLLTILDSDEASERLDECAKELHRAFKGSLLNRSTGRIGKPIGTEDSASGRKNKRESRRARGCLPELLTLTHAQVHEITVAVRREQGFPNPELNCAHPVNRGARERHQREHPDWFFYQEYRKKRVALLKKVAKERGLKRGEYRFY